ncbi:uncharacterized protein LOC119576339 isoform X6 [Penaeus monodon]|uniref:uncharacterized protein LOC119576339 isoform X6 n=1 Tax=Penaeus monodon TaxID=6687 RepID=UPI0018A7B446|nr:uncharacterized protein LOC119576339 isoform X6 [Penaeus monodon]
MRDIISVRALSALQKKRRLVKRGDEILTSKPFCFVLENSVIGQYCETCLATARKERLLSRCKGCWRAWYCSDICRDLGETQHRHECQLFRDRPDYRPKDFARFLARLIRKLKEGGEDVVERIDARRSRRFRDLMSHSKEIEKDQKRLDYLAEMMPDLQVLLGKSNIPEREELIQIFGKSGGRPAGDGEQLLPAGPPPEARGDEPVPGGVHLRPLLRAQRLRVVRREQAGGADAGGVAGAPPGHGAHQLPGHHELARAPPDLPAGQLLLRLRLPPLPGRGARAHGLLHQMPLEGLRHPRACGRERHGVGGPLRGVWILQVPAGRRLRVHRGRRVHEGGAGGPRRGESQPGGVARRDGGAGGPPAPAQPVAQQEPGGARHRLRQHAAVERRARPRARERSGHQVRGTSRQVVPFLATICCILVSICTTTGPNIPTSACTS